MTVARLYRGRVLWKYQPALCAGGRENGRWHRMFTVFPAMFPGESMPQTGGERAGAGALLRIDNVSVRFGGIVALDQVSFAIESGAIAGLIGPNGAGKTTLFNCLSRLYDVEQGSIEFDGQPLLAAPRHRIAAMGIGRTFQNVALFRSMSVLDNILLGRHCRGGSGFFSNALRLPRVRREEREAMGKAREMIAFLELDAVAATRVADLPFGTQKRVELGRALLGEPKLLLLDEPASGLNHSEVETLGQLIRDVRDRLRVTILLVEHHMNLVMGVSDKVVALDFGRKIAEGAPAEVREHPELIRAYLGTALGTAH
jgi:branched-chain amino acid transport system ATP-binding protein